MTDAQIDRFIAYIDNALAPIKDELAAMHIRFDDIDKTLDYLVGEVSDLKDEFGFFGQQTTEKLDNHETRITQLELAPR